MTPRDWAELGGMLAFAGAVYMEVRNIRTVLAAMRDDFLKYLYQRSEP